MKLTTKLLKKLIMEEMKDLMADETLEMAKEALSDKLEDMGQMSSITWYKEPIGNTYAEFDSQDGGKVRIKIDGSEGSWNYKFEYNGEESRPLDIDEFANIYDTY